MENNIQIYLANGIDESLVGLELGGWKVKIIHENPTDQDGLGDGLRYPRRILNISMFFPIIIVPLKILIVFTWRNKWSIPLIFVLLLMPVDCLS